MFLYVFLKADTYCIIPIELFTNVFFYINYSTINHNNGSYFTRPLATIILYA